MNGRKIQIPILQWGVIAWHFCICVMNGREYKYKYTSMGCDSLIQVEVLLREQELWMLGSKGGTLIQDPSNLRKAFRSGSTSSLEKPSDWGDHFPWINNIVSFFGISINVILCCRLAKTSEWFAPLKKQLLHIFSTLLLLLTRTGTLSVREKKKGTVLASQRHPLSNKVWSTWWHCTTEL